MGAGFVDAPAVRADPRRPPGRPRRARAGRAACAPLPSTALASTYAKLRKRLPGAGKAPRREPRGPPEPVSRARSAPDDGSNARSTSAPSSWGAKGENADVFERLLLEAFRDHVFWRRNFHPEDGFLVREVEKHTPAYERSISILSQELLGLLGELKAGVPFFSPRYIGHMSSDLTMASLIGYFATLLYNPNNVAAEASPVTSRMELEVAAQLARDDRLRRRPPVGPPHLRRHGRQLRGALGRPQRQVPPRRRCAGPRRRWARRVAMRLAGGERARHRRARPLAAAQHPRRRRARRRASASAPSSATPYRALEVLGHHSLAGLGYQEFGRRLAAEFGDALPPGVVLVPSTAHYSWEKICRSLGIGGAQLVHVPVDDRFRMDPRRPGGDARTASPRAASPSSPASPSSAPPRRAPSTGWTWCARCASAPARELGLAFHLHADAAWGGYAASITRAPGGARRSYEEALADYAPELWPEEGVYRALVRAGAHRLGHHRPAQARLRAPTPPAPISFRDRPGARPRGGRGALPLPPRGVGVGLHRPLHLRGLQARRRRRRRLDVAQGAARSTPPATAASSARPPGAPGSSTAASPPATGTPSASSPLPPPDLNIVCFALGHPAAGDARGDATPSSTASTAR